MKTTCLYCGIEFNTQPHRLLSGRGKYCSKGCKCASQVGTTRSYETRLKMRNASLGKPKSPEHVKNSTEGLRGLKRSDKTRSRIGESHKGLLVGKRNPAWKGGITPLTRAIRTMPEYLEWRNTVFKRDSYTCVITGDTCGRFEAHHVKPFHVIVQEEHITSIEDARNSNQLWDANNGITLNKSVHEELHRG